MSEQVNPGQAEEQETPSSGLLLSVEPLQGSGRLSASPADTVDTDTDMTDTGDAESDSDGTDTSDTDGTDDAGGDMTDGTDTLGDATDGTDTSKDTDSTDS
jgi:hypothetical protein